MGFRDIPKCFVVVDFNNQVYRALHATERQKLTNDNGINTGCIIGVAKILNLAISKAKEFQLSPQLVICEDRVPIRKRQLYEERKSIFSEPTLYKGNRKKKDLFYNPIEVCRQFIDCIPHIKIYAEGEEADDVIASFVNSHSNSPLHIYSTDKDLWQMLAKFVNIKIILGDGTIVDEELVKKRFDGGGSDHVILHKMVRGDSGDNVKSVMRFPFAKNVNSYLRCNGEPENFLKCIRDDRGETSKEYCQLIENSELLYLNYNIVNLKYDIPFTTEIFREPKPDVWRKLCNRFQTPSLFRSPLVNIF
jgi:5'-3' exonuclease